MFFCIKPSCCHSKFIGRSKDAQAKCKSTNIHSSWEKYPGGWYAKQQGCPEEGNCPEGPSTLRSHGIGEQGRHSTSALQLKRL